MELLGRKRADCAGDRPASGRIPMLSKRGLTRSVLLYIPQTDDLPYLRMAAAATDC
jgi:hypothetical protein